MKLVQSSRCFNTKAKDGVIVRFLYDGLGSNTLRRRFLQPMKEAGIEIVEFDPIFQLGYLKLSIIVTIEKLLL